MQTCLEYTWTNAQVTLNRLGLKHKLIGPSSGNIVYQYPVGGSDVPAGSTVYLYTATDQNSMTTVPDVAGKTGTFAEQMLKAANLNVQFSGDSGGKVVSQSVEAGHQRRLRHNHHPDHGQRGRHPRRNYPRRRGRNHRPGECGRVIQKSAIYRGRVCPARNFPISNRLSFTAGPHMYGPTS